jgi:hypothetical protein
MLALIASLIRNHLLFFSSSKYLFFQVKDDSSFAERIAQQQEVYKTLDDQTASIEILRDGELHQIHFREQ